MIKVKFKPPKGNEEWDAWLKEAEAEARKIKRLARSRQKIVYKPTLYKKMRKVIFEGFYGKCAYCEGKFILTQTGDVEHFRPKGGITDENNRKVMISRGRPARPHPGYYWLAYEWRNLLPSCSLCNRSRKGTRFPVLASPALRCGHARHPRDVDKELPVFIHPVLENPQKHLFFEPHTGLLIYRTERGRLCIDLLGLNSEVLSEARRDAYYDVLAHLRAAVSSMEEGDLKTFNESLRIIDSYKKGLKAYCLAGRQAFKDRADLEARLKSLRHLAI